MDMPSPNLPSNRFDLTHNVTTTSNMGELIPVSWVEALPGDYFTISDESMHRFQAMVAPVFADCRVTMHVWFVPLRLLWARWEDFITGVNPALAHPFVDFTGATAGTIADYLGLPLG